MDKASGGHVGNIQTWFSLSRKISLNWWPPLKHTYSGECSYATFPLGWPWFGSIRVRKSIRQPHFWYVKGKSISQLQQDHHTINIILNIMPHYKPSNLNLDGDFQTYVLYVQPPLPWGILDPIFDLKRHLFFKGRVRIPKVMRPTSWATSLQIAGHVKKVSRHRWVLLLLLL